MYFWACLVTSCNRHDIWSFLFWGPNSLRSNMWTPGRIKISIYHTHEFYKTIKKRGKDLYSACLGEIFTDMAPAKWEIILYSIRHYILFTPSSLNSSIICSRLWKWMPLMPAFIAPMTFFSVSSINTHLSGVRS